LIADLVLKFIDVDEIEEYVDDEDVSIFLVMFLVVFMWKIVFILGY
jgi:hypothetical protein